MMEYFTARSCGSGLYIHSHHRWSMNDNITDDLRDRCNQLTTGGSLAFKMELRMIKDGVWVEDIRKEKSLCINDDDNTTSVVCVQCCNTLKREGAFHWSDEIHLHMTEDYFNDWFDVKCHSWDIH